MTYPATEKKQQKCINQENSQDFGVNDTFILKVLLYEQFLEKLNNQESTTQHQLFSSTIELSVLDTQIFNDILDQVNKLVFDIQPFGKNTFIVNGIPAEMAGRQEELKVIEQLIENYKFGLDLKLDIQENLARAMAKSAAIKKGQKLSVEEMHSLIDKLFACTIPYKSPSGRNCIHTFELEELAKLFDA